MRQPDAPGRRAAVFVGHDIYRRAAYGTMHPLAIPRVESVVDLCHVLDWFGPGEYRTSPQASEAELAGFHDAAYVRALREAAHAGRVDHATRERYGIGTMENPVFPGLFERAATSVGGSILAAEIALSGSIAFHPAGGTHHGRRDRASGFCYFNDPVFAIRRLHQGGCQRVFYVDLDAHHGDGVEIAFAADARVHTLSIHEAGRWPYTGDLADTAGGRACNLPVPRDFADAELRILLEDVVLPLAERLAPDALVLTCGGDALAGDPLTRMALSNVALWDAVEALVPLAPRVVVLGGGGYNPWTLTRYWTGLWARLSGRTIPDGLSDAAQQVLRQLHCELVEEEDVRDEWLTTLADAPNDAPARAQIAALRDQARARLRLAPRGTPVARHAPGEARAADDGAAAVTPEDRGGCTQ